MLRCGKKVRVLTTTPSQDKCSLECIFVQTKLWSVYQSTILAPLILSYETSSVLQVSEYYYQLIFLNIKFIYKKGTNILQPLLSETRPGDLVMPDPIG